MALPALGLGALVGGAAADVIGSAVSGGTQTRTPTKAKPGGLQVGLKIEGLDRTQAEFKEARRHINGRVKNGLKDAADRVAMPVAKAVAPGFARPFLVTKSTTRNAYVTTRGPRWVGRALGYWEYGGKIDGPMKASPGTAIPVAPGVFRATVTNPRTFPGTKRISRGLEARRPAIEAAVERQVIKAFDGLPHD